MRIERIELYNFGSYEGLNTFELMSGDETKRIVIIGGKNGAGKTTLFTAIQVCLYGHASFGFKTSGKRYLKEVYDLINNQARLDESKYAYVKICFSESRINTDRYEITRTWSWTGRAIREDLAVTQNNVPLGEEEALDFQNYLLHLIPPELQRLYFFDGERIAAYFLDEQHNNIKDALLILSGNDTYEILYHNVRRLLRGVESDGESAAQTYADQKDVLEKYARQEAELFAEQNKILSDLERLESALQEENDKYALSGGVSPEEWKDLQNRLKDEEARREKLNGSLKDAAAEVLPFLMVKDLLAEVREQISTEKELHTYQTLQASLGAPRFQKYLSRAVKKTSSQDPAADAAVLIHAIQSFFENRELETKEAIFKLSEDESASILNRISSIEAFDAAEIRRGRLEVDASSRHSAALRERVQKSSIEHYEAHFKKISEITSQLERLDRRLEENKSRLSALQDETAALNKALSISRKALEEELKKKSVSALSDRVLLLVEELQRQQYKKLIADVERDLNSKFKELIRKDNFVDHIYLGQDFSLHLVRNQAVESSALKLLAQKHGAAALNGSLAPVAYHALIEQLHTTEEDLGSALKAYAEEAIVLPIELDHTRFSNGEKQILVMALYWAIMNQSHNELPFIIDTPFARIDTEHRANITEKLFKTFPGQLLVLSTNEELRHEHIAALDRQIANVYTLEYGEDKRTHISQGTYFGVE